MVDYRLSKAFAQLLGLVWYRRVFANFGRGSFMIAPIGLVGPEYIRIGQNVRVRHHLRLEAIDKMRRPSIEIGDNTNIEQNVHIVCSSKIHIGHNCSITANCCITDTSHPFDATANVKIGETLNTEPAEVIIGDGSFIGIAASILPNVRLGNRSVVASHAVVVAGNYPDGAVLIGAPARIARILPN